MGILHKKSKHNVGIDISDLSLKAIQVDRKQDGVVLIAASKIKLPKGVIENGEIIDFDKALHYLNKLFDKPFYGKFTNRNAVACLPESRTFIKLLTIEKTPNKISDLINTEIEKNVPLSLNDIYFDWQIIEENSDNSLVLLGVSQKKIVDQYSKLFNDAKISIEAMEIESAAICRCLLAEENPKDKGKTSGNYAIIDIGAKNTLMLFYSKNTILFSISMPISGEAITRKISQLLEMDPKQAEQAKLICGLAEDKAQGAIRRILAETIDSLVERLQSAFGYYEMNFSDRGNIEKIFLTGGGSNIKGLPEIIKDAVNIEVEKGNTLGDFLDNSDLLTKVFEERFKIEENEQASTEKSYFKQGSSPTYATAIGLALRSVYLEDV